MPWWSCPPKTSKLRKCRNVSLQDLLLPCEGTQGVSLTMLKSLASPEAEKLVLINNTLQPN